MPFPLPRLFSSLPPNTTAPFPVASKMRLTGQVDPTAKIRLHGNRRQLSGPLLARSGPLSLSSLRSVLSLCNSPQMNSPEAYIQFTPGLITDYGEVTDDTTAEFLQSFMAEFHAYISRVYTVLPRPAEDHGARSAMTQQQDEAARALAS